MAKVAKKTTQAITKKVRKAETVSAMPVMSTPMVETKPAAAMPMNKSNNKVMTAALIVIIVAALTYKVGPWMFPAMVGNMPVTRFGMWSRLEKSYGAQTLDDMVNEKVLDTAIAKSGIKVDQKKVDDQIKALDEQFKATGGLDAALKQRGLTRKDLDKQVRTQLAIETLLADKIMPTTDEVKKEFDDNAKTTYKDKKFEEVQASITDQLKQAKLRDAFLVWFAEAKKGVTVKTLDPSLSAPAVPTDPSATN